MARSSVPEFGKWEDEGNVPYTVYFEKARKNKGGKMINPNDPQENPEMFANTAFSAPDPTPAPPSRNRAQQEEPIKRGANKSAVHQHRESREDSDHFRQFADSPARNRNGGRGAAASESPYQQYGGRGTGSGRPSRQSAGSEQSFERSPLHPNHQARLTGRGNGSPFLEGKRSNETPHGTPARTRMQPKTRDEAPSRDVIPKFGEWDVNDPQSADNYTYIFGQNGKSNKVPDTNSTQKQHIDDDEKFSQKCCFPWGRK